MLFDARQHLSVSKLLRKQAMAMPLKMRKPKMASANAHLALAKLAMKKGHLRPAKPPRASPTPKGIGAVPEEQASAPSAPPMPQMPSAEPAGDSQPEDGAE